MCVHMYIYIYVWVCVFVPLCDFLCILLLSFMEFEVFVSPVLLLRPAEQAQKGTLTLGLRVSFFLL